MKTFTATALALVASLSLASAAPAKVARDNYEVCVTLMGAAGAQYEIYVPYGQCIDTDQDLSISTVQYDHNQAECSFTGVDEATAPPVEANIDWATGVGALGPPQTITQVECNYIGA